MSVPSRPKRRRRSRATVVTTAVLSVVALVLTGFAVNYEGLDSSDIDVSNGGVWVSSAEDSMIGRLNVDAGELDARLSSTGQDLDIIQSGYHVFETGPRGMTPINTASITRNGLVELPPDSRVAIGGDRVAIASPDGKVWVLSPEEAAAFSPSAVEPNVETGNGIAPIAVSPTGTVFVLEDSTLHTLRRQVDSRKTTVDRTVEIAGLSTDDEQVQLTAVGDSPVILDRENRMLRLGTDGRDYPLEEYGISTLEGAQVQQSGPSSDRVVLATADTMLLVPLDGGTAQTIAAEGTGTQIAQPAQVQGCAYGAWSGSMKFVRACEGQDPVVGTIPQADPASDLTLRQNRDLVVLNDQEFGLSWEIMDSMEVVDAWKIMQEIQTDDSETEEEETLTTTIENLAVERSEENRPPVANDDTFGVRPGASVVLPVTRNDVDPDGDVLTVRVQGDQPGIGRVTPIRGGTQLQVEVDEDAATNAAFTYVTDDGRGGTDTATVTLEVRGEIENSAPQAAQDGMTKVLVRSGQEVSFNLLPYWEDPDGDAFYLANATVEPEDLVTFRPDGQVTFNDAGLSPGTKQVTLTFRDEFGETGEGTIEVESVTETDLAPITTADHVSIVAGRNTTLKPLANDLNPNGGSLELISVGAVEGLEVDPILESGTVNVVGAAAGTYYLEYTVGASGSSSTSLGLMRVDVVEPNAQNLEPVAVDDMGNVTTGADTLVAPLENDVDPTGGVLVVNSLVVPANTGLKATVVDHHLVRVEAEPGATVSQEPVPITYEVSNSAGTSTGTIRMMVVSTDTQFATPEAVPDRAVVRAGDMVNIDVTANDISPTGSELHLGQGMNTDRSEALGHAEPNQDYLRFRANDDASGEAVVRYEVVDETGRTGAALAHITIIPRDAANNPPRPENLTARAVAGTPVRIPVSTTGIDPDGDSVMLTGITSPMPTLGEVVSANGEWIEYLPYEGSVGTDRFRYQMMDRDGAIGTAEVLVGISAPTDRNQAPFAVADTIEVRPDREVQIPVLTNDTDPEGDPLAVVREDVEAMTEIEVVPQAGDAEDGFVTVTTPAEEGTHTVLYAATDGQLKSSASATVKVAENAPPRAPVARDDFVAIEDVLDPEAEYIDVDVLANDTDPDGSTNDLQVTLDGSFDGAQLTGDRVLRITPQEEQQRIRYIIRDQDDLTSAGYVWVPGTAKQAPVWVGETLQVQAGAEVEIDLADSANVRVRPGGQPAKITDTSKVSSTHGDGSDLVRNETTLVYRPAADYSGADTITVEVTDGEVGDTSAAVATLAIPVEVAAEDTNLPPTLQGALLQVEQGAPQASLDLSVGAEDPEGDELTYALGTFDAPAEIDVSLDDSILLASATTQATKGQIIDVPVTVTDGTNDPVPASVQLTVVGSQRPLLTTVRDDAVINAGESQAIPVLENDSNPFPGGNRELTDASRISGEGNIELQGDNVVVTPAADYKGILTAQYGVLDDTGDPDRKVTGEIRVEVRGYPDPPSAPRIGEIGDGFVELTFNAGNDNGAPITGYTVSAASGGAVSQQCASTSCIITGLTNDTEYTFQVVATNEVGDSEPSAPSAAARPDVRPERPGAPQAERGDQQLTVAWSAPVNRGSAIQSYLVQMQDTAGQGISTQEVAGGSTQTVFSGLTNGRDYRFRVQASNLADEPSEWSDWSVAEHPAGAPKAPSGTATAERINDPVGGGITVTWPAMTAEEANGEPITQYIVTASSGASQTLDAGTRSTTFRGLDADIEHTFTYTGVNSVGRGTGSSRPSNAVTPWAEPSAPTGVTASMPDEGTGSGPNGRANVSWNAANGNGTSVTKYVVRWNGGSKTVNAPATSVAVDGLRNGTSYRFTVEARNGFEADGGVSRQSDPSNAVTPYTKPANPSVASSNATCADANGCPVTLRASAPGGDGGAGGKTLQVRIDGGSWQDSGTSFSRTLQAKSGATHRIEARVKNSKGLVSGTVTETRRAQTYTPPPPPPPPPPPTTQPPTTQPPTTRPPTTPPPAPSSSAVFGAQANNNVCQSEYCRNVDIRVSNLEPGKSYDMSVYTNASPSFAGGPWTVNGSTTIKITADGSGNYSTSGAGYRFLYGYPENTFTVSINSKAAGTHSYP